MAKGLGSIYLHIFYIHLHKENLPKTYFKQNPTLRWEKILEKDEASQKSFFFRIFQANFQVGATVSSQMDF